MRLILSLLLLAACVPQPTPAIVARLSGEAASAAMQACVVNIRWSEEELLRQCGAPDLFVSWRGHDGRCAVYRTAARTFWNGQGADALAVCLENPGEDRAGRSRALRVVEVYGLDAKDLSQLR